MEFILGSLNDILATVVVVARVGRFIVFCLDILLLTCLALDTFIYDPIPFKAQQFIASSFHHLILTISSHVYMVCPKPRCSFRHGLEVLNLFAG